MRNDLKWGSFLGNIDFSIIEEFENKIAFKFPKTYKEIVSRFDGARIVNKLDSFDIYSNLSEKNDTYGIGCFLAYNLNDRENIIYYWRDKDKNPEFPFPKNIVPFSLDGGGDLICFDYRHDVSTNEPKIVVWHHEGEPGTDEEISFVANSFDEFLDMLYDEDALSIEQ
jgi:uncharacterized protein Usg